MSRTRLVLKKANLALLLLGAGLVGFCIGFQTNAAVVRARVRAISTLPENMPAFLTDRLTEVLCLDGEQRTAIQNIMERHDAKMKEARARGRAEVDALVAELDAAIDEQLTPEQKVKQRKYLAEIRKKAQENRQLKRAAGAK